MLMPQAAADAKHPAKQPAAAAADSNFKTPAPPKAATRIGAGADAAAAAAAGGGGSRAAGAGGSGTGGDSPSLTITVLDPVSTGGCVQHSMRHSTCPQRVIQAVTVWLLAQVLALLCC
jgi:hypothetical protein